jgi:RNA polymerase sigma factor (sigma-70 family)
MDDAPPPERSFGTLYQATLSPLRRYLATLLGGSAHDAQDIAHDAYMRTYRAMQEQPVNQPKAFLFTTARRLALNYRMRRSSRMIPAGHSALEPLAPATADAGTELAARQEKEALAAAIAALPAGCRNVLVLRHTEELSHAEIAERLGLARSSVEKHLARALRLLREELHGQRARENREDRA